MTVLTGEGRPLPGLPDSEHAGRLAKVSAPVLAALLLFAAPGFLPIPLVEGNPAIRWESERLWLSAQAVPLGVVLQEVAGAVGMTLAGGADVRDPVSLQLDGVTLADALQRLLGGHSYLLIGDKGADPASFRLVVLSGRGGPASHGAAASSGGSSEAERGQPAQPVGADTPAPPEPTFASLDGASSEVLELVLADVGADDVAAAAFERLSARDPRDAVRVALGLAESPDGAQRLRALEFLDRAEGADRGEILAGMDHGASDEDDGVRAYALSALALRGGGQSEEILRRELRNPDPDARIVAIQSIAERDPTSVLVRQALADEDPRVAEYARALIVEAGPREEL